MSYHRPFWALAAGSGYLALSSTSLLVLVDDSEMLYVCTVHTYILGCGF
jgi:hypothetical protein